MIELHISLQHTDEIPEEVAKWLVERNDKYPGIKFIVGRHEVQEVDKPREEQGLRAMREKYVKTFSPLRFTGPHTFDTSAVVFLYGKESWFVRITGMVNEKGEITIENTTVETREGFFKTKPLPPQLRNEIAGLDLSKMERIEYEEKEGEKSEKKVIYAERRTEEQPLREHPEKFLKVEWDIRKTGLYMTGQEFMEAFKDPEKREALEGLIQAHREGNIH